MALLMISGQIKWRHNFKLILSTAVWLVLTAFFAHVLHWQKYYNEENQTIWTKIQQSPTNTAYHDTGAMCPLTTLFYPTYRTWVDPAQLAAINCSDTKHITAVVPSALQTLTAKSIITPIDGDAGLLEHNGAIIEPNFDMSDIINSAGACGWGSKDENYTITNISVPLTYYLADGQIWWNVPSLKTKFITASGDTLVSVRPQYWRVKGPYKRIDKFEW